MWQKLNQARATGYPRDENLWLNVQKRITIASLLLLRIPIRQFLFRCHSEHQIGELAISLHMFLEGISERR